MSVMLAKEEFVEKDIEKVFARDIIGLVQPKIDGLRGVVSDNRIRSRNWHIYNTPYMNEFAKNWTAFVEGKHCPIIKPDGEFLFGQKMFGGSFRKSSRLRNSAFAGDLTYFIFDDYARTYEYYKWLNSVREWFALFGELVEVNGVGFQTIKIPVFAHTVTVILIPTFTVVSLKQIYSYEEMFLTHKAEGLMFRTIGSPYKFGPNRPLGKQSYLVKLKRFEDAEAEIIGVEQMMVNTNPQKLSQDGTRQVRGSCAFDEFGEPLMIPQEMVGAFILRKTDGTEFKVGSGLTDHERSKFWKMRSELIGKLVTYKYFPIGDYDKPRNPVFKTIRED